MKRSQIKRKPRRGGAMPPHVYDAVMRRNGGVCEAGLKGCEGAAVDWHHRQRRQAGNDVIQNGLALCRACHHRITFVTPAEGKELGLIVHSHHPDPGSVPVCVRGVWVLLTAGGGYERTAEVA